MASLKGHPADALAVENELSDYPQDYYDQADWQARFIFGFLNYQQPSGLALGSVGISPKITIKKFKLDQPSNVGTIFYHYENTANLRATWLVAEKMDLSFGLPRNPATFNDAGKRNIKIDPDKTTNPCTDPDHSASWALYYFWDPKRPGCSIQTTDMWGITAHVVRKPSVAKSWPLRKRLFSGNNGNGKHVKFVFVASPNVTTDDGNWADADAYAESYNQLVNGLQNQVIALFPNAQPALKTRASFQQTVVSSNGISYDFDARLIDRDTPEFLKFAEDGLQNADVFVYLGHSGLGKTFDLNRFPSELGHKLTLRPDKYQIFFFSSCISTIYYTQSFFNLKKTAADPNGTENLEIIGNGISPPTIQPQAAVILVRDLIFEKTLNYESIVHEMALPLGLYSGLMNVSGNEDASNQTPP